jgi:hypothetical protein
MRLSTFSALRRDLEQYLLRETFWLPTGEHSMALFMKTDPNLNLEKEEILGFRP